MPPDRDQLPIIMAEYLAFLDLRGSSATAVSVYYVILHLARWMSAKSLTVERITAVDLATYQEHLATVHRGPRDVPLGRVALDTRIARIKGYFRWCVDRDHLCSDPSLALRVRVAKSRVVLHEPLSLQEATALVQCQAGVVMAAKVGSHTRAEALRNLAGLCLGLATGRRIGGMTTLHVDHIDLDRREIRVEREKGLSGRVLPVAGWAIDVVRLYLAEARPLLSRGHAVPWLFVNVPGRGPITATSFHWFLRGLVSRTIAENADLTDLPGRAVTWHCLRVSFATMLFGNGCGIRSVNELLLHRSLNTTARYTPIPIADLRRVFSSAHPRP